MSHFHEDTEIFAQIVDNRGFSHAARKLGISPALVSRRVRALEKNLGVTLLTRSTRKFELTPEGILLYQHAKKVLNDKVRFILLESIGKAIITDEVSPDVVEQVIINDE